MRRVDVTKFTPSHASGGAGVLREAGEAIDLGARRKSPTLHAKQRQEKSSHSWKR
eukprot:m.156288 g.156288  ORF g.156288 m.156288 type:complete len:55 (-) comp14430_c0_seq2:1933-2097(-)